MDHEKDFDRDNNREDELMSQELKNILEKSYQTENDLMRTYLMTSERIHNNSDLKNRLENFAEGNAKRTRQLLDEIKNI